MKQSSRLRHSGMVRKHQTSDVQLQIGESRVSGFDASHCPGLTGLWITPLLAMTEIMERHYA
jgi:hypothetical protein